MSADLSDDEYACLMIAAEGGWLAPIGRWEKPVLRMAQLGLMFKHDAVNYGITPAGREAIANREKADDQRLGQALTNLGRAQEVQGSIQDFAEQAAQLLAQAARTSSLVTGDTSRIAMLRWIEVIKRRALELLR